jgi:hypothetical protein
MRTRVSIPWFVLVWVIIGILVAVNKGYDNFETADQIATFILAVVLWPIPALGGAVSVNL